ncbi:MAG TPA: hypothetical protein PK504_05200 [Ferruginibacter sp.]|nr:hypothetical protein [Ferruginibacter sp.]HRE63972.1 hypothetical protein [Ferruginibacter sp.]
MKIKILPIALMATIALTSCSTAYKSGQTPDDVYFSPARVVEENEDRAKEEDRIDPEEREIRMATRDRRWRYQYWDYDYNYNCNYHPYSYGYNHGYYYNPYYYPYPVYPGYGWTFVNPKNTTPRTTNLRSYINNNMVTIGDPKLGTSQTISSRKIYNNSNNAGSNGGGFVRRILTSGNNNNSSNNDRSYSPSNASGRSSSSGSSSSGSTRSSGTSVSRPSRGN